MSEQSQNMYENKEKQDTMAEVNLDMYVDLTEFDSKNRLVTHHFHLRGVLYACCADTVNAIE
jgi:hypothetical protein